MLPISGSTSTTGEGEAKMRWCMIKSCNGCRALRKGCSDDCTIRPCLQWIKTPEAQGNATSFLAKFYGRAGLLNLIAAAPDDNARPAVFRSLLHEACGRVVNPVYGSVGLLWSHQWEKCVNAVDAVLKGNPIVPVDAAAVLKGGPNPVVHVDAASSEADAAPPPLGAKPGTPPAYNFRHFAKNSNDAVAADLLRFARAGRKGFKRAAGSSSNSSKAKRLKGKGKASNNVRESPSAPLGQHQEAEELEPVPMVVELAHVGGRGEEFAVSHGHYLQGSKENTDVEAASHVSQAEAVLPVSRQVLVADQEAEEEVGPELMLGFGPVPVVRQQLPA